MTLTDTDKCIFHISELFCLRYIFVLYKYNASFNSECLLIRISHASYFQDSVVTYLRCDEIFIDDCYKFAAEYVENWSAMSKLQRII